MNVNELRIIKAQVNRGYLKFCHRRSLDPDDIFNNGMGDLRRAHRARMQERAEKYRKARSEAVDAH